ncbi:MAG: hypothetical protein WDN31_16825 [Hyphomicrobium sp.]
MMEDTTLADTVWWLKRLLFRPPSRVPPTVTETWIAGIVVVLALLAMLCVYAWLALELVRAISHSLAQAAGWLAAGVVLGGVLWFLRRVVLVQFAGDAARYLTPSPQNIGARTRIRLAGRKLLCALHKDDAYNRVIVVGHSLGTVVGYDLLNFYWSDLNDQIQHDAKDAALIAVEDAGREVRDDPAGAIDGFQTAQRGYSRTFASAPAGNGRLAISSRSARRSPMRMC